MLAAPVHPGDIALGEPVLYLTLALSALIVTVGAVLFGGSWGDPGAAAALITVWAPGPAIGIAFGRLGGGMWPLECRPRSAPSANLGPTLLGSGRVD